MQEVSVCSVLTNTVFRKNTHSRSLSYLRGKCLDLHKIIRLCLWGIKYPKNIKNYIVFATGDVILTSCLHVCVCVIMGFTIEDKRLIKYLQVSSSNEYLILTSMECIITDKHTLKFLYKLKHFPPIYKRKREWVFLLSEHWTKTPTRVFFYISVENVSICTKFSGYFSEEWGISSKSKFNIYCIQIFIVYRGSVKRIIHKHVNMTSELRHR